MCCMFVFCFVDNENLTFRGNSIATKAMEAYIKIVGEGVNLIYLPALLCVLYGFIYNKKYSFSIIHMHG